MFFRFCLNSVQDETVETFSLAGGIVLDDLALTFLDDDVDAVVGFFVVSGCRFFLGVIIIGIFHRITSDLY